MHVFDLKGASGRMRRVYAWFHEPQDGQHDITTVLHGRKVSSPFKAVRTATVARARTARGGKDGLRAENCLRRALGRACLYPPPIADEFISDLLDGYIRMLEALPNGGLVPRSKRGAADLLKKNGPKRFDAPKEMEQAARRIIWCLNGGETSAWHRTAKIADIVLRRHGPRLTKNEFDDVLEMSLGVGASRADAGNPRILDTGASSASC